MEATSEYRCSDIVRKIHNNHIIAQQSGKNISYTWIYGQWLLHTDGNEQAYTAAKLAHSSPDALISPILISSPLTTQRD